MKRAVATLSLALLVVPALALADDGPPPPAPAGAQNTQIRSQLHQLRTQMEQMHMQARAQMLSALSPAHRQLLANIAGQLAISPNPDREAAARQLNAALGSGEQQSIVRIHENLRTQTKALMQNVRAEMEAANPNGPGAQQHPTGMAPNMQRPPQDAGHILLGMSAMGGMHGGMDMMRGPGPGGPGAPGAFHPN
jgi:hypothetical protein